MESKPRKKYSSEEDAAMAPHDVQAPTDSAYFYHQQMMAARDGFPVDSEVAPPYDEFDPARGIYVGLDGMGMDIEGEEGSPDSGGMDRMAMIE